LEIKIKYLLVFIILSCHILLSFLFIPLANIEYMSRILPFFIFTPITLVLTSILSFSILLPIFILFLLNLRKSKPIYLKAGVVYGVVVSSFIMFSALIYASIGMVITLTIPVVVSIILITQQDKDTIEPKKLEIPKKVKIEKKPKKITEKVQQLKKMLKVSTKIKLEMMRDALEMDPQSFNRIIFDWADQFGFVIDEDVVIINNESVNDFINMLDSQFESWENKEKKKDGKI